VPFGPGDHAEHDLLVVFFERERVTVAVDAGCGRTSMVTPPPIAFIFRSKGREAWTRSGARLA
jgi:hypothetical protein